LSEFDIKDLLGSTEHTSIPATQYRTRKTTAPSRGTSQQIGTAVSAAIGYHSSGRRCSVVRADS
jgi:hypothetical protein